MTSVISVPKMTTTTTTTASGGGGGSGRPPLVHTKSASPSVWRKTSDGASVACLYEVAADGVVSPSSPAVYRKDSPPRRERLFELLVRYARRPSSSAAASAASASCEACVSWSRSPEVQSERARCGGDCAESNSGRKPRRGSDPYAVTFNRILSAKENRELMEILSLKQKMLLEEVESPAQSDREEQQQQQGKGEQQQQGEDGKRKVCFQSILFSRCSICLRSYERFSFFCVMITSSLLQQRGDFMAQSTGICCSVTLNLLRFQA